MSCRIDRRLTALVSFFSGNAEDHYRKKKCQCSQRERDFYSEGCKGKPENGLFTVFYDAGPAKPVYQPVIIPLRRGKSWDSCCKTVVKGDGAICFFYQISL